MIFLNLIEIFTFIGCFLMLFLNADLNNSSFKNFHNDALKTYTLEIRSYEMDINEIFKNINEEFESCLNWYSIVFAPYRFSDLILPSFPSGLFIFFSINKNNSCEVDKKLIELFLSISNIRDMFDTSNARETVKIYSKQDILNGLKKGFKTEVLMEILSNINQFSPNHPELYSLNDEKLNYIYFPLLKFNIYAFNELLRVFFGISEFPEPLFYLRRVFEFNDSTNRWYTKITISKLEHINSTNSCVNDDFKIIRRISGGGFHWNLETEISSSVQDVYWIMLDMFNRQIFLDVDEIFQKNERIDGINGTLIPLHPVHIERPSEESQSSLLLSIGTKSQIPIHMRYQSACNDCSYKSVQLATPAIFIYRRNETNEKFCMVLDSKFELSRKNGIGRANSQNEIIISVPVGNTRDTNYVLIVTLFIITVTTITTGISIVKY